MYHIIYETKNLINNKIYIGYHFQTIYPYLFDGYYGSGDNLMKAINKYNKENFIRKTLFVYDNEVSALDKEAEIVNNEFIKLPHVYNIVLGGGKPPNHLGIPKSKKHKQKIGLSQKGKNIPNSQREKISNSLLGQKRGPRKEKTKNVIRKALLGKKHNENRKQNMKNNQPDRSGKNNSMFGKLGTNNPNFGKKRNSNTRKLMIKSALESQTVIECPHCKKIGKRSGMQRWHFNNCKTIRP